jgi:hypothetical protein
MKHIALIGTEGSGKTVLLTVLAKRFGRHEPGRPYMNPSGKTLRFVEKNWRLLNDGRWPDTNTQGVALQELQWRCRTPEGEELDLRAVDCAGQDLRKLFDDHPPAELAPLHEYTASAQVVLFLINPGDFIGLADEDQAIENHVVIKEAMDRARLAGSRCGIVFTQSDLYAGLAQSHGGWPDVARSIVPSVHGGHVAGGDVPVFAVSAVSDTEVTETDEGRALRVPKPEFGSSGLDELMTWIVTSARAAADLLPAVPAVSEPVYPPQTVQDSPPKRAGWGPWIWSFIAVVVLGFLLLRSCEKPCPKCGGSGKITHWWRSDETCSMCGGSGRVFK